MHYSPPPMTSEGRDGAHQCWLFLVRGGGRDEAPCQRCGPPPWAHPPRQPAAPNSRLLSPDAPPPMMRAAAPPPNRWITINSMRSPSPPLGPSLPVSLSAAGYLWWQAAVGTRTIHRIRLLNLKSEPNPAATLRKAMNSGIRRACLLKSALNRSRSAAPTYHDSGTPHPTT